MPFYTGSTRDERNPNRPFLSVLVFGTAPDGALGESRWFFDTEEAAFAYGGASIARFNPGPADTSVIFPKTFLPDSPSLSGDPRQLLYHVNPSTGHPIQYTGLSNQTASRRPIHLTFDAIGYDPSVAVYDGGLVIQTAGYASHGLNGDILLPLISTIGETGFDGTNLVNVGGCRVGSSWLPSEPPQVAFSVGPGSLVFTCRNQGDGTLNDTYLTISIIIRSDALIIDPGQLGLPYTRHTYTFSNYASWNDLWDRIEQDCTAGLQPLRLVSRISRTDPIALSIPSPNVVGLAPSVYPVTYQDSSLGAPDLTSSAGWLVVLAENDLPLDECPFLIFSGLTGKALVEDPDSTIELLKILDNNGNGSDENPDLILIVPWSLTPPVLGVPYNAAADADALINLVTAIGAQLASRLLVVWGGMTQNILPPALDRTPFQIPAAYAAAGALIRESSIVGLPSNVLHPEIKTISASYISPILIKNAAEVPSPAFPTSIPSPTDLETLRVAGLTGLTRSVGDRWCLHSPILLANRDPLRFTLCEAVLRERVQRGLDRYLGENNTTLTRMKISETLSTIASSVAAKNDAISQQISDFSLEIIPSSIQETQLISVLAIEGRMTLYGETSSITFQVNLKS